MSLDSQGAADDRKGAFPRAAGGIYNFPLNQPALWAEPIVRREAHER